MKFFFYFFLALALALPFRRACAQDAPSRLKDPTLDNTIEPTPLPRSNVTPAPQKTPPQIQLQPSPTATPSVTETPAPIVSPTPEKSPTQLEKKTVPKRESTPSRPKQGAKVQATPAVHAETHPTPEANLNSWGERRAVASKLKALEKEWEASFNDPVVIEKSVADDFVGTSPAGKLMRKKDLLREAKENTDPPPKTIAHDLTVYFHGADIAVVTGAAKQLNRNRSGQIVEHNYRFTDTWVQRDGIWKCIASQSMLVTHE